MMQPARTCLSLMLLISAYPAGRTSGRTLMASNGTAKPPAAAAAAAVARLQQQSPDPGYAINRPSFVMFGDSITEFGYNGPSGWITLLAQYYSRKADVINRGMSGWNTRWASTVLPATLAELMPQQPSSSSSNISRDGSSDSTEPWDPKIQLLVIWFGANDAVIPSGKDGFLAVPVDEYKSNLVMMVTTAKIAGVPNIVLITPPPVDEAAWAKTQNRNVSDRTTAQARKYATAMKAAGMELKVPVLDMFSLVSALPADERASWSVDGLHPSASGQAMVFRAIKEALDNWGAFASIRQSSLPIQWPGYDQVNANDPQQTFDELFEKQRVMPQQ